MQFTEHNNSIKITVPVTLDALSAHDVNTQLQAAGFGRCLIIQDQITNLLVEYQQIQQKIKEKLQPEGAQLTYRIAEKRDAELSFNIADDQMSAAAIITAAWGGAPVSANALVKSAQEAGIVFGFSKEHIIKLVSHASKAEPGSKVKLVIARGRPVVHGENSRFEPLIPEMQSRRNKPLVQSEEKADLRDFGVIPAVRAGDTLMRRHPPTAGIDGMTVTGSAIAAVPGQVDFTLQPPQKKNMLTTIGDFITALDNPNISGSAFNEAVNDVLTQIDNASSNIDSTLSAIGGRVNVLDSVFGTNEDLTINNKAYRADLSEVDYAAAITEITKQEIALEAISATFTKVSGVSLFDYLR